MTITAVSWTDLCQADTDGVLAATSTGTTSLVVNPAYPAHNGLDNDPSLVSRWDYTRNAVGFSPILVEANFSAVANSLVHVAAALNCRLPANCDFVSVQGLNVSGTLVWSSTSFTPATLIPIPGTTDRYNLFWLVPNGALINRIRLSVNVLASTSGYIEVGRLWVGPALQAVEEHIWTQDNDDASDVQRGRGGALTAFSMPVLGRLELTFIESFENSFQNALSFRNLAAEAGTSSPVVVFRGETQQEHQLMSVYAAMERIPATTRFSPKLYRTSFQTKQIK